MKKEKLIFVIGFIFILVGLMMMLMANGLNSTDANNKSQDQLNTTTNNSGSTNTEQNIINNDPSNNNTPIQDMPSNKSTGENKKLMSEHSVGSLHVKDIIIVVESKTSYVVGEVINKSNKEMNDGFVNIEFKVGNKTIVEHFYYNELPPNVSIPIQIGAVNPEILKAKKYTLKFPTEEEVSKYRSEMQ